MYEKTYTRWLENLTIGLLLLTVVNVFVDVVLRYAFSNSSIGLQEMEWHLFSAMFLLGIAYTLQKDAHVRVDIFYAGLQQHTQAVINIAGFFVFVVPISLLIAYYGIDFTYQSYVLGEQSGDPGGLQYRFIIKGFIPLSFVLVIVSGLIFVKENILRMRS